MRHTDPTTVFENALTAAKGGAEITGASRVRWDIADNCEDPVVVHSWHLQPRDLRGAPSGHGRDVEYKVRCRKCPACLRARRAHWSARAMQECALAPRTYFGTLTLSMEWQVRFMYEACRRCRLRGVDFDGLTEPEQFKARVNALVSEVQRYLKRVRWHYPHPIRYLYVAEPHQSGLPHLHMLVHEVSQPGEGEEGKLPAILEKEWPFGFTKWALVTDGNSARYVTKYLSKEASCRVRASRHYGELLQVAPDAERRADADVLQEDRLNAPTRSERTTPEPKNSTTVEKERSDVF